MAKQGIRRVQMADEWRGLVILLMVFYHGLYDLVVIFGVDFPWFWTKWAHFLQVFIAGSFIILSGMCCHFSRNNLKRGAIAFGLGLLMTLATWIALPSQVIRFGVLHLLGASMMLFALLRPHVILSFLPFVLGALLLLDGVGKLPVMLDAIQTHAPGMAYGVASTLVPLILGIVLLINPFQAAQMVIQFFGLGLILDGVADFIAARSIR